MALDDNDKKAIGELIAAALKANNDEQAKAVDATVGKAVKALDLDGKLKALDIDGKLEAVKTELKVEPPADPPKGGKGGSVTDDPEFKKLQAELAKVQKTAEEQAKRAKDAEAAQKAEALANGVRDALVAGGADPKRVQIALSHLTATGRIKLDDKGQPAFAFTRDWGEELAPAAKGATEWLGTDEGKLFVPPVGSQGSGDGVQPGNRNAKGPSTAPRTKEGTVDFGALRGRMNIAPLVGAED